MPDIHPLIHSAIPQVFSELLPVPGAMLGDRNVTVIVRDINGAAVLREVDRQISKTMMPHVLVRATETN